MTVTPYGFFSPRVDYTPDTATDYLRPRRTVSLYPEDSILYKGIPMVPLSGVKPEIIISTEGIVLAERVPLAYVNQDTWASFVVDDIFWDDVTGIWTPIRDSSPVVYYFEGTPGDLPTYQTVQYRSEKELFLIDALTLDEGQALDTNFNQGNDDAVSFTMAMAVILLSADESQMVLFSDGSHIDITPLGFSATMDGNTWTVNPPEGPMKYSPLYLVFSVSKMVATLAVGFSPSLIYRGSSSVERTTTSLDFTLSAPMHIFSVDIWNGVSLDPTEIVSRYATALGATVSSIGSFA